MKNLIFLVIDSFGNKDINNLGFDLMPFITQLKKTSFYCPNMYSEAPYTEAAMMSLICGTDTMQNGGYFYRFRDNKTIMDYFSAQNYDVVNYMQPHVFPSSVLRGSNYPFYNVCYDFNVLWNYRLNYYADRKDSNLLSSQDINKVKILLDENFNEWINFFQMYLKKDYKLSLISKNIGLSTETKDIVDGLKVIQEELEKYNKNKEKYILELLKSKTNHKLFRIPVLNQTNKINNETKEWIKENYTGLFKEIYKKNKIMNKRVSKISFSNVKFDLKAIRKGKNINSVKMFLRYFKYYKESYDDSDLMERISNNCDSFKSAPSASSHINHFKKWLNERDTAKNYMAYIHVDDIHNPEEFFTYDTDNKEILKKEFSKVKKTLDRIPNSMTGSVTYYLSLAYIDSVIKEFFEYLNSIGEFENTSLIITGDHGFSFDNIILRNSRVNNFYLENYNVPFIFYDNDSNPCLNTDMCSSKDILATVVKSFGLQTNDKLYGRDLFNMNGEQIITIEYMGGGCPDIDNKDVYVAAFDRNWLVCSKSNISSKFKDIKVCEIYDLNNDPNQLHNLIYRKSELTYQKYIYNAIEKRFNFLYINYTKMKG